MEIGRERESKREREREREREKGREKRSRREREGDWKKERACKRERKRGEEGDRYRERGRKREEDRERDREWEVGEGRREGGESREEGGNDEITTLYFRQQKMLRRHGRPGPGDVRHVLRPEPGHRRYRSPPPQVLTHETFSSIFKNLIFSYCLAIGVSFAYNSSSIVFNGGLGQSVSPQLGFFSGANGVGVVVFTALALTLCRDGQALSDAKAEAWEAVEDYMGSHAEGKY